MHCAELVIERAEVMRQVLGVFCLDEFVIQVVAENELVEVGLQELQLPGTLEARTVHEVHFFRCVHEVVLQTRRSHNLS